LQLIINQQNDRKAPVISFSYSKEEAEELRPGVFSTGIDGLYYLPHRIFADNRGFYTELARVPEIDELTGDKFMIKQTNLSMSVTNVARGMHAEDWNKLATVLTGRCFSALADVRPGSATFGKVETFVFGPDEGELQGSLYISRGLANSFAVLEGPAYYLYAVDALYAGRNLNNDLAISLFDKDLAVNWPIPQEKMIISERDRSSVSLRDKYPEKFA